MKLVDIRLSRKLPGIVLGMVFLSVLLSIVGSYVMTRNQVIKAGNEKLLTLAVFRASALDMLLENVQSELQSQQISPAVTVAVRALDNGWSAIKGDQTQLLQADFVTGNPYPADERDKLDAPEGNGAKYLGGRYASAHKRSHSYFRALLDTHGYEDIYMISPQGNVVYSVKKRADYATNLLDGPYSDTGLAETFRQIDANQNPEFVAFTDFSFYEPSGGRPASFIGASVHEFDGTYLGALIFEMPNSRLNRLMSQTEGLGETGEIYIVGEDMLMRSNSRFSDESTILKSEVGGVSATKGLSGDTGYDLVLDYRGVPVLSAYVPFEFLGTKWAMLAEMDEEEAMRPVLDATLTLIVIGAVVLLISSVVGFWFARRIADPISSMVGDMTDLANGNLDKTIAFDNRGDDIGDMARAVKVFQVNSKEAIRLREEQEELERRNTEERLASRARMANDFEASVGGVINTVTSAATELLASSNEMATTAEEASMRSSDVARASGEASGNVQTVASATEELSTTVQEIGQQVQQAAGIADRAVHEAGDTTQTVGALSSSVEKIGEVISLINSIAEQTNLLALNATIEAARAGDAGKGFAVVASEVKSLANQTAKATEEIESQIMSVQEGTSSAVRAIDSISSTIGEISSISSAIAAAVEEQLAATQEIARSVEQASAGTATVSENIVSVESAARATGEAASGIKGAASELSEQSEYLQGEVAKFLEEIRSS